MTTLDHPLAIAGSISAPFKRRRMSATVLQCNPRFRILRALLYVFRLRPMKHQALSALLHAHWQCTRTHSSWSRA